MLAAEGAAMPWERSGPASAAHSQAAQPPASAPASSPAKPDSEAAHDVGGETAGFDPSMLAAEGTAMPWERAGAPSAAQPVAAPPPADESIVHDQAGQTAAASSEVVREAMLPWQRSGEAEPADDPPAAAEPTPVEPTPIESTPVEPGTETASVQADPQVEEALPWLRAGAATSTGMQAAAEPPPPIDPAEPPHAEAGATRTIDASVLRRASAAAGQPWQPAKPHVAAAPIEVQPWEQKIGSQAVFAEDPAQQHDPNFTAAIDPKQLQELRAQAPFALAPEGQAQPEGQAAPDLAGAPWAAEAGSQVQRPGLYDATKPIERQALLAFLNEQKLLAPRRRLAASSAKMLIPERRGDGIPIVNPTQTMSAACLPWQVRPPQPSLTVVVKACFTLQPDAAPTACEPAELICGDLHLDDDPAKSLRYSTDLVCFKPQADVTLVGTAQPPAADATSMGVVFRFGDDPCFDRRLMVYGDRSWVPNTPVEKVEPAAFEQMALCYERAYGGADHAANPVGVGHGVELSDEPVALPNLVMAADETTSDEQLLAPACFGPMPLSWRLGALDPDSYGERWVAERWPYYPDDFDYQLLQAAPAEQRLPYLRGDEPFEISGVLADGASLAGSLPGVRARVFAQRSRSTGGAFEELNMQLDTVAFDSDTMRLTLLWRGLLEVRDRTATDVATLFVLSEELEGPQLGVEEARERLQACMLELEMVDESSLASSKPANDDDNADDSGSSRLRDKRAAAEAKLAKAGIGPVGVSSAAVSAIAARLAPPDTATTPRQTVEARLAAGEPLEGLDLQGADLSGLDLSGQRLAGTNLQQAKLQGCRFDGADLSGALLSQADASAASFARACLELADLSDAKLKAASFDGAQLSRASMMRVDGREASFRGAQGHGVLLEAARLTAARFDEAELSDADLSGAELDNTCFDRAILPRLCLLDAFGKSPSFNSAQLIEARADGACFTDADFAMANASDSVWEGATLESARFDYAQLCAVSFSKALLNGASFSRAVLKQARFAGADLRQASLAKSDLMAASLEDANLEQADLSEANLFAVETHGANLTGARTDDALIAKTRLQPKQEAAT